MYPRPRPALCDNRRFQASSPAPLLKPSAVATCTSQPVRIPDPCRGRRRRKAVAAAEVPGIRWPGDHKEVGVKSRVWGELRQAERQRKEGKRAEVWNGRGGGGGAGL